MFKKSSNKPVNLFIIEDNAMYSFFLKYHVHENYGLNVFDFLTFELCIEYQGEIIPDIILLDYELPHINGTQTIPLLKKLWPGAEILVISSRVDENTAHKLEKMNILHCVAKKDCTVSELNKMIDCALMKLEVTA